MNKRKNSDRNSEHGIIIVWIGGGLALFLAIVSIVIDLALLRLTKLEIVQLSRTASYAAVREFDGTQAGYDAAKRVALLAIRNSNLRSATASLGSIAAYAPAGGVHPEWNQENESNPQFVSNIIEAGNFSGQFHRGAFWVGNDGTPEKTFQTFEGQEKTFGLPAFALANSVQVTGNLSNLGTLFAGAMGYDELSVVQHSAVVTFDDMSDICVAPLAIPACDLFLDTSGGVPEEGTGNNTYETDQFTPAGQCGRELTFTEADWHVDERVDGIVRSESYPRPPYITVGANNMIDQDVFAMKGFIGIPDTSNLDFTGGTTPSPIAHSDILAYLETFMSSAEGCISVGELGSRFRPIESFLNSDGTNPGAVLHNHRVAKKLSDWINGSGTTFESVFGNITANSDEQNFPYLRSLRTGAPACPPNDPNDTIPDPELSLTSDLNIGTPGNTKARMFPMGNLTPSASGNPWEDEWSATPTNVWTNPLCHNSARNDPLAAGDPDWVGNDTGIPRNDPTNARVRQVRVMLIAPHDDMDDTTDEPSYCDHMNRVGDYELPDWEQPYADTQPRVVGYITANVFDFNIMDLGLQFAPDLADPTQPTTAVPPGDRNPMTVTSDEQFNCSYNTGPGEPSGQYWYWPSQYGYGFPYSPSWPPNPPLIPGIPAWDLNDCGSLWQNRPQVPNWWANLNPQLTNLPATSPTYCNTALGNQNLTVAGQAVSPPAPPPNTCMDQFPNQWPLAIVTPPAGGFPLAPVNGGTGLPQYQNAFDFRLVTRHCIPAAEYPATDCPSGSYNDDDNSCWSIRDRQPQYGCGGLRARIACDAKLIPASAPEGATGFNPVIVDG